MAADDLCDVLRDDMIERWFRNTKSQQQQGDYVNKYTERRNDQLCEDVLEQIQFRSWFEAPGSRWLTLVGDADSGKTTVVTWLVDEVYKLWSSENRRPICYYYCLDKCDNPLRDMYSTMVYELVQELPPLRSTFFAWQQDKQVSTANLGDILHALVKNLKTEIFFVVDGLDKCGDASQRAILEALDSLSRCRATTKILLTSRPQTVTTEELKNTTELCMDFNSDRNTQIVEFQVGRQLGGLSPKLQDMVMTRLSALGMKRRTWTAVMVDSIRVTRIDTWEPMRLYLDSLDQNDDR